MLEKAAPKTLASMSTGRTPLLATDNPEEKRAEIRAYFHATFDKTEQLFGLLTKYVPSHRALGHQIPPQGGLGSHVTISSPVCLACRSPRDEAYYIKHETLRHPPIFYYGHTACFFVNKLILAKTVTERINPKIEHMCAVGVDEMSPPSR